MPQVDLALGIPPSLLRRAYSWALTVPITIGPAAQNSATARNDGGGVFLADIPHFLAVWRAGTAGIPLNSPAIETQPPVIAAGALAGLYLSQFRIAANVNGRDLWQSNILLPALSVCRVGRNTAQPVYAYVIDAGATLNVTVANDSATETAAVNVTWTGIKIPGVNTLADIDRIIGR
jgi:hypothetical protein